MNSFERMNNNNIVVKNVLSMTKRKKACVCMRVQKLRDSEKGKKIQTADLKNISTGIGFLLNPLLEVLE